MTLEFLKNWTTLRMFSWDLSKNFEFRIFCGTWKDASFLKNVATMHRFLLFSIVLITNIEESLKNPVSFKIPINHFISRASFYTPWKYQKDSGFLMFSGGIERGQWQVCVNILSYYLVSANWKSINNTVCYFFLRWISY